MTTKTKTKKTAKSLNDKAIKKLMDRTVHLTLGPIRKKAADQGEFVQEHCKAECTGKDKPFWESSIDLKKITCKDCKKLYSKSKAKIDKLIRELKKRRKATHHADDATVSRGWGDFYDDQKVYAAEEKAFKERFPGGFPKIKEVKFDLKGHFKDEDDEEEEIDEDDDFGGSHFLRQVRTSLSLAESTIKHPSIYKRRHKDDDEDRWVTDLGKGKLLIHGSCLNRCYKCSGEIEFELDLKTKTATATTECKHANGFGPYSVEMDIPSGKLVIANDLRQFIDVAADYDVNYEEGCKRTAEAYAANGMFHFFLGNTCPGIYQKGDFITIGNAKHDEVDYVDEDGKKIQQKIIDAANKAADKKAKEREKPYGKDLGSVCTDLWWYCGVDYEYLKKKAGKDFKRIIKDHYTTIVKLTPGRYKATGLTHVARQHERKEMKAHSPVFELRSALERKWVESLLKQGNRGDEKKWRKLLDTPKEELKARLKVAEEEYKKVKAQAPDFDVYGTIERVGDCTGKLFMEEELKNQEDPGFEEYIKLSRLAYPSLYPTRARVLDHTFCVIGNGLEWRNGSLYRTSEAYERARRELAAGTKAEFPSEELPASFYPMCDYSRMSTVPDDVRPDWLAGVYETIDLVLKSDPKLKSSAGHENAANIKFATKVKADLDKRFGGCPEKQEDGTFKFIRQPAVTSA